MQQFLATAIDYAGYLVYLVIIAKIVRALVLQILKSIGKPVETEESNEGKQQYRPGGAKVQKRARPAH